MHIEAQRGSEGLGGLLAICLRKALNYKSAQNFKNAARLAQPAQLSCSLFGVPVRM